MEWYLIPWKKYFDFTGRARRKEYWTFTLITQVIGGIIGAFLYPSVSACGSIVPSVIYLIFILAVFIPSLAVTVRRLHDTNRSGWLCLISPIPIVGWILMMVWMCSDSNLGENDFGPDPKANISKYSPTEENEIV